MVKTVFKSAELPHLWAHQLQEFGRNPQGSERFSGKSYYSYGTEIARIIERKGKRAYLLNETSYSATTSAHQGDVRRAIPNGPVFHIGGIHMGDTLSGVTGAQIFDYAIKQAADCADRAKRARVNKDWHVSRQAEWLDEARAVATFYGLRRVVDNKAVERLQARLAKQRAKETKEQKERQAALEKHNQEAIVAWLQGVGGALFPRTVDKVYLRKVGDSLETSKGVTVPWKDAVRAFKFALRHKNWRTNGQVCPIGNYRLDAINEAGIVAGCHRVTWEEVERLAKLEGVI